MDTENKVNFSEVLAAQSRRMREWLKPEPSDATAIKIIKMILKSIVMLVLLLISPVLLIGLALAFIGLM